MHIGFDISQTGTGRAGCGFYAHAMIRAMLELAPEHRYSLFPSFGDFYFDPRMPLTNPYQSDNARYGPRHISRVQAGEFWLRPNLEALIGKPDILHANNFWTPIQVQSSRVIYTLYDMGFAIDPSWSTEANRVGCFEGVFRSSVAADWVVAISEASRTHYLEVFPHFPADRIRVIYPCSRFSGTATTGRPPRALDKIASGDFWLSVGTIEPRKNQRRLVDAYAQYMALGGAPKPLVLAGGNGWLMDDFQSHLNELGLADRVVMTGYVSDEELVWLYRNCYANLYPSLFEGFGLPVLEGMQFGAPTIASRSTSIPEVTGDAALLLAPEDTDGWARAMARVAADPELRERLSRASFSRAAGFDWKQSAQSMLKLYSDAVAVPKRRDASS